MLAETAYKAGLITKKEFAILQNAGCMGIMVLRCDDIHKKGKE